MQISVNILIAASTIFLMALGFSLIYTVTRFFHFAHAILFTAGAYFAFVFNVWMGFPLALAILLAVAVTALGGCLLELSIYRPLRRQGGSPLVLLIASLGTYIALQNVISLIFGDDTKSLRSNVVREGFNILGARITAVQLVTVLASVGLMVLVLLLLKKTELGKAMRAVASDAELACLSGIESRRVILWTFAIGSALAGVAGILVALDVDMTPTMGMMPLMLGIVALYIGGVGSLPGIAVGALLLATAQQVAVWYIGSAWQDPVAFFLLLLFLLFRPVGIFGRPEATATV